MESSQRRPVLQSSEQLTRLDLVSCPECGAPAEITDRTVLQSTDGPIEHVVVRCVDRHWFRMPTSMLSTAL